MPMIERGAIGQLRVIRAEVEAIGNDVLARECHIWPDVAGGNLRLLRNSNADVGLDE